MHRQNTLSQAGRVPPLPEAEISGLVKHLNKEQLQKLHDNEDHLLSILEDMQDTKRIQQDRKMLVAANKSLAEYNLSLKEKLEQGKVQLVTKHERAQQLHAEHSRLQSQLDSRGVGQSVDTVHAVLQTKQAETDERAEDLASEFIDGKVNIADFLEEFSASKKLSHMRRIKAEKMAELITSGGAEQRQQVPQSFSAPYPANGTAPYPAHPTPYPQTSGYGMPNPAHGSSRLS